MADDLLTDFTTETFTAADTTKRVFRSGDGPAVIVMTEVPGITPKVADFARRVVAAGMSVWMPDLFGQAGKEPSAPYIVSTMARNCVSKEFSSFALRSTSPVTTWLRALAAHAHEVCGGVGVGAIGMCWTGGFALGMMVDDIVVAPVLSQPSLPIAVTKKSRSDIGIGDDDLATLRARAERGACVMGLRFTNDIAVPPERFERLRTELGDNFIGIEIDSSKGNVHGIPSSAHSVVTEHLVDTEGHPTRDALDAVLEFLATRLEVE